MQSPQRGEYQPHIRRASFEDERLQTESPRKNTWETTIPLPGATRMMLRSGPSQVNNEEKKPDSVA